jgi:hypothetical protein
MTTKVDSVLPELAQLGVVLWIGGDRLLYRSPRDALTVELRGRWRSTAIRSSLACPPHRPHLLLGSRFRQSSRPCQFSPQRSQNGGPKPCATLLDPC